MQMKSFKKPGIVSRILKTFSEDELKNIVVERLSAVILHTDVTRTMIINVFAAMREHLLSTTALHIPEEPLFLHTQPRGNGKTTSSRNWLYYKLNYRSRSISIINPRSYGKTIGWADIETVRL